MLEIFLMIFFLGAVTRFIAAGESVFNIYLGRVLLVWIPGAAFFYFGLTGIRSESSEAPILICVGLVLYVIAFTFAISALRAAKKCQEQKKAMKQD